MKIKRRTKIFIITFTLSLLFFWGINLMEKSLSEFFFWHELSKHRHIFKAHVALSQKMNEMAPLKNRFAPELELEAKSAISVLIADDKERILFEKDIDEKLAMASLTKLMTAIITLEHYDLSKEIIISEESVNQHGSINKLEQGKSFTAKYLLYPLLIESSNNAAFALANDYPEMNEKLFVELMNQKAKELEMKNTFFINSSGLDPEDFNGKTNYSTVDDLTKLTKELLENPIIWEILSLPRYSEYGPELINTNRFLIDNETDWQKRIVGGKTGYTRQAGGCLLLVVEMPRNQGFLVSIILGANGRDVRFYEMKKLVDWLKIAYQW